MHAETGSPPKPNCPPEAILLAAVTKLEDAVAILAAWQEFVARGRRHDA